MCETAKKSDWPQYRYIQKILHWAVAGLVIPLVVVGFVLGFLGFEGSVSAFGSVVTNNLYVAHKTGGILILVLMIIRVVARTKFGKPHYAIPLEYKWQKMSSEVVHASLYAVLIVMPVSGWVANATGGYPINFFGWVLPPLLAENAQISSAFFNLHGILGWALAALSIVHISGGIYHWLIRRDGVITRMSLFTTPNREK